MNKSSKVYVVQSDTDRNKVWVFKQRTTLCQVMEEETGVAWVKASIDYYFNRKKLTSGNYKGYKVWLVDYHKGVPRGRNVKIMNK